MNTELLSILSRLSPSNERLVRELIWKLAQLEQLTIPEDHDSRLDFYSYIDQWLQSMLARGMSPETIRTYHGRLRNVLKRYPHPTQTHLEAALAEQVALGRTPGTVAATINALRSFFGYLAERDIITTNPALGIHRPHLPTTIREAATQEQAQALFSLCSNTKYRLILLILCDTGARVSELAAIQLHRISTDYITVTGKKKKERRLPISSSTAEAIEQQRHFLDEVGYTGYWLFPGRDLGEHITADSIRDYLERLCRKAGLPKLTPHQFRHYFASAMLSGGANLKITSAILGHARVSTTADIYWHIIDRQEIISQHSKYSPLKGALCQE